MTITHKLTQHYAVTTPPRYLTTGNACKSRFILIISFPITAPIGTAVRIAIALQYTPIHNIMCPGKAKRIFV